jgi:hypothetical protein
MADNLTTFMCRLSRNLGAPISWKPVGLSRPVMGELYLYLLVRVTAKKLDQKVKLLIYTWKVPGSYPIPDTNDHE